jgi:hypothetical protein
MEKSELNAVFKGEFFRGSIFKPELNTSGNTLECTRQVYGLLFLPFK